MSTESTQSTERTATVYITNNMGGNASILLFHNNSSNGTQRGSWVAGPGQTVGPLTVYFQTGIGTGGILDYWSVQVNVLDGPSAGQYINSGTTLDPYWKECQLQHKDSGQTITLTVSPSMFNVNLPSGGCPNPMTKIAPPAAITNVFVVMLENHSFDHLFAMSGISGIHGANTGDSNEYNGQTYYVKSGAPTTMPSDPGHEFLDVLEQLAGVGAVYPPGGAYPTIDNSGFAANYATSTSEGPLPPTIDIGDIMACFDTPTQLPVIYQLATEFALCDQWYSSLPGPTWPNRFFVHGASSSGLDDSPSTFQMGKWELPGGGFVYPNGSIYQTLNNARIPYRLYNDFNTSASAYGESLYSDDPQNGSIAGGVPQVTSLQGITVASTYSLERFAADLQGPYPFPYTFIEPHYGDVTSATYAGGSSQHPMDDVYGGENLLKAVYEAIRASPYWNTSLLIVTYDEHGGFYDSVAPVGAPAPGDHPNYGYSVHGFTFEQYGVRVPAVVVSPLIAAGTVDHALYDHASVLATVEDLYGLNALTQRDASAENLNTLLTLATPRTNCPTTLNNPAVSTMTKRTPMTPELKAMIDLQPVPEKGNLPGVLAIMMKTEIELSAGTPAERAAIVARVESIKTRGEARAYIAEVMQKVRAVKAARDAKQVRR